MTAKSENLVATCDLSHIESEFHNSCLKIKKIQTDADGVSNMFPVQEFREYIIYPFSQCAVPQIIKRYVNFLLIDNLKEFLNVYDVIFSPRGCPLYDITRCDKRICLAKLHIWKLLWLAKTCQGEDVGLSDLFLADTFEKGVKDSDKKLKIMRMKEYIDMERTFNKFFSVYKYISDYPDILHEWLCFVQLKNNDVDGILPLPPSPFLSANMLQLLNASVLKSFPYFKDINNATVPGNYSLNQRFCYFDEKVHEYPHIKTVKEWDEMISCLVSLYNFQMEQILTIMSKHNKMTQQCFAKIIVLVSWFVCNFLSLHPFGDGNGRVARFVVMHVFTCFVGLPIYICEDMSAAMTKYQKNGNLKPFINLLLKSLYSVKTSLSFCNAMYHHMPTDFESSVDFLPKFCEIEDAKLKVEFSPFHVNYEIFKNISEKKDRSFCDVQRDGISLLDYIEEYKMIQDRVKEDET